MSGATNCPETPRQKMIGMMYLVLTAMLALNVSTNVLDAFEKVDNSLHVTLDNTDEQNAMQYRRFERAYAENPQKVGQLYIQADSLRKASDDLYNYIQDFKDHIIILADGQKEVDARIAAGEKPEEHIGANDNLDVTGQYAIAEGNGLILKDLIAYYRDYVADLVENDAALRNSIEQNLATARGYNAHAKDSCDWEIAVFEMMPVGASITILTKLQNDVRATEGQVVQYLMDRTDAGDLRVNKLSAYVIPKSGYVIRGGKYSAQIILAAVDSTQTPEYYVDGQRLGEHGIYEVPASTVGVKKYSGWIAYQDPSTGEMQNLPFSSEYSVGEPAVTISNNDLNIMYRKYPNKFSISVPGVSNDKVKVSVTGAQVKQQGGLWIIEPGETAKTVTISVSAELDGKMQPMGSRDYRVKMLPPPSAYFSVRDREYPTGNIAASALANSSGTIIASYGPDGLLDVPFKVTSFIAFIGGRSSDSKGNKFTQEQLNQIGKLKKGGMVILQNIKAVSPTGQEQTLSPLVLTVN